MSWSLLQKLLRFAFRAAIFLTIAAVVAVGATLLQLSSSSKTANGAVTVVSVSLFGAAALGILAATAVTWVSAATSRARRRRLANRIEDEWRDEDTSSAAAQLTTEEVRLKEYSARREEAEHELISHLPLNPRRAKRLVNHERLYALIAEDRGIFGGEPGLTHRHLAKWVLIVEGWPRLGAALTRDPAAMAALERSETASELQAALDTIVQGVRASDELLQVVHEGVPLWPVLARLVRFESAPSDASDTSALAGRSIAASLPVPPDGGEKDPAVPLPRPGAASG